MPRLTLIFMLAAKPLFAQTALPFGDGHWELRGDSTVIDTVHGRASVRMETGYAYRRDVRLEDGTIDVDVKVTRRRSFVFVGFRMRSDDDHEEFYLRPHKSSLPDAAQYTPVYRGQTQWQLYHGPGATASPNIEPDVWTRLRIVLSGPRAAVFLGDTTSPILVISHLAREPRPGYIALYAFLPSESPGAGPIARFANVRVQPGVIPYVFGAQAPEAAVVPGVIRSWTVGEAFVAPDTVLTAVPRGAFARTIRVPAEPGGLVELERFVRRPPGIVTVPGRRSDVGVVARVHVVAQAGGLRRLDLGFSDAITVLVNGRPIFHGDQSYDYERRRDGLIGFDQATLYLPLRAGRNEIAVIVTDHFGGWGIMGRFLETDGLRVEPDE